MDERPNEDARFPGYDGLTNVQLAKKDPETYAYFSLACYYAQIGDKAGKRFNFADGMAVAI